MTATEENKEEVQEEEVEVEVLLPNTNIVTHCVLKAAAARLAKCFDDDEDPFKENVAELITERGDDGKSPLDIASTLGRVEIIRELLHRGADVNDTTEKGYCALHHAAAWGQVSVLKVLVEFSADLQQRNCHGERARETALRYNKSECVDFLDWAEARKALLDAIKGIQETLADPEKIQGRWVKDDKVLVTNTCKEKSDWIENTPEATTSDFITQKLEMEERLAATLAKLTEERPVSAKVKGAKKSK
ncbi:ankyrin repeat domain-containing protein 45-like isoform X1 [Liolophura sinensis]|uniref:ankyrin repeat domain-containing protein 45-like isoform X1 n=1 Tax=Liolophura sinensis TaxID=3198878 RepID=UPI0031587324